MPVTAPSTAVNAKGMYVYNTNPDVGEGVYVWDGYQWLLVKASIGEKPVTHISISSSSGFNIVEKGSNITLSAVIEPSDASNTKFVWSVDRGTGNGSINNAGIFTGSQIGVASVRVTAPNGIEAVANVYVVPAGAVPVIQPIGGSSYATYNFNGTVWMIEDSNEGPEPSYTMWGNMPDRMQNYYSHYFSTGIAKAKAACPDGWRIPTLIEGTALAEYLSDPSTPEYEWAFWTDPNQCHGHYQIPNWFGWGRTNTIMTTTANYYVRYTGSRVIADGMSGGHSVTVRCIQSE